LEYFQIFGIYYSKMKLFGRKLPTDHPCAAGLAQMSDGGGDSGSRAMAANLIHDHRVSETREREFAPYVAAPAGAREIEDAVRNYKDARVRKASRPDFAEETLNGNNIIKGVSGDTEYATLVDITGLHDLFKNSKDPVFSTYPRTVYDQQEVRRYLDARLKGPGHVTAQFMAAVLGLMNGNRPYHPIWLMRWTTFEDIAREGGDRWCEAIGRPIEDRFAHWIIMLKLKLRDAGGTIVRPTVLDAGWWPAHFPSPPQALLDDGGFAMDLRSDPVPEVLRSEFIAAQPVYQIHQWLEGDSPKDLAGPTSGDLERQRTQHLELLERNFGPDVKSWMARSI
jgi:hypothetical protein